MNIAVAGWTIAGDLHGTATGGIGPAACVQQVTWPVGAIFVVQILELDLDVCTRETYAAHSGQQIRFCSFSVENIINEDTIFAQAG